VGRTPHPDQSLPFSSMEEWPVLTRPASVRFREGLPSSMIPKRPAPDLIRGVKRISESNTNECVVAKRERGRLQNGYERGQHPSTHPYYLAHDLVRKPLHTPDQVRGRPFRDHA